MIAQVLRSFVFSSLIFGVAAAQPGPYLPTNTPDANQLAADRVRFVKEMYSLDPAGNDKIAKDLTALVPFQEKFLKDAAKSIYRIELAITIVNNDTQTPEAERPAKLERFRNQLADVYARAPLSLANVIRMADGATTPDKADMAHAKIAAKLSEQLKGQPLVIPKVDGLLTPPSKTGVPMPVINAATPPAPAQPAPTPAMPAPKAGQQAPSANQPQITPSPFVPPAVQNPPVPAPVIPALPPPPPRNVGPAPALDQWKPNVEATMEKYAFTPDQKKIAEKVLDQCKLRAELAKSKGDEPAKPAEGAAAKTTGSSKPTDLVYDELMQRVDSLATAEQKAKTEKKQVPAASQAAGK